MGCKLDRAMQRKAVCLTFHFPCVGRVISLPGLPTSMSIVVSLPECKLSGKVL